MEALRRLAVNGQGFANISSHHSSSGSCPASGLPHFHAVPPSRRQAAPPRDRHAALGRRVVTGASRTRLPAATSSHADRSVLRNPAASVYPVARTNKSSPAPSPRSGRSTAMRNAPHATRPLSRVLPLRDVLSFPYLHYIPSWRAETDWLRRTRQPRRILRSCGQKRRKLLVLSDRDASV